MCVGGGEEGNAVQLHGIRSLRDYLNIDKLNNKKEILVSECE
jgi:hypothetical protein